MAQVAHWLQAPVNSHIARFWARAAHGCAEGDAETLAEANLSHQLITAVREAHPVILEQSVTLADKLAKLPCYLHAAACQHAMQPDDNGGMQLVLTAAKPEHCQSLLAAAAVLQEQEQQCSVVLQLCNSFLDGGRTMQAATQFAKRMQRCAHVAITSIELSTATLDSSGAVSQLGCTLQACDGKLRALSVTAQMGIHALGLLREVNECKCVLSELEVLCLQDPHRFRRAPYSSRMDWHRVIDSEVLAPVLKRARNLQSLDLSTVTADFDENSVGALGRLQQLRHFTPPHGMSRACFAELSRLTNLQSLIVPQRTRGVVAVPVARMTALRELDLRNTALGSRMYTGAAVLTQLSHLTALQELSLQLAPEPEALSNSLSTLTQLTSLHLCGARDQEQGTELVISLAQLTNLRALSVHDGVLGKDGTQWLAFVVSDMTKLTRAEFVDNGECVVDVAYVMRTLAERGSFEHLRWSNPDVIERRQPLLNVFAVEWLSNLTCLTALDLSYSGTAATEVLHLSQQLSLLRDLQQLDLSGHQWQDVGARAVVVRTARLAHLTSLAMSNCDISAACATELATWGTRVFRRPVGWLSAAQTSDDAACNVSARQLRHQRRDQAAAVNVSH